jgi:twitching motility protein PilT
MSHASTTDSLQANDLETTLFGQNQGDSSAKFAAAMILAMLDTGDGISDLIFSPGRPPQVEKHGELTAVAIPDVPLLQPGHTARVARDLIAGNAQALRTLKDQGACDLSYSLPEHARFRVNVFRQRGAVGAVLRVIPIKIKSSTLAAIIDVINETRADHILTIEDPIEFLHLHKKGTVHQRELHSDTPTFALALRAALRQAPKVILVGEMRDRDTIEIALTAAETGHLVFSTLHTIDASKTVDRIIGAFEAGDQQTIRTRLAACFRYFISQRLIPKTGGGRLAILEVLKSTLRTRDYLERGDSEGKSLLDAMRDGELDGMQHFDGEIEKLVRGGVISMATGLLYATNAGNLRVQLADYVAEQEQTLIVR